MDDLDKTGIIILVCVLTAAVITICLIAIIVYRKKWCRKSKARKERTPLDLKARKERTPLDLKAHVELIHVSSESVEGTYPGCRVELGDNGNYAKEEGRFHLADLINAADDKPVVWAPPLPPPPPDPPNPN